METLIFIVNKAVQVFYVCVIMLCILILIGNFFRKKTILTKILMYGSMESLLAFLFGVLGSFLLATTTIYERSDILEKGVSVGTFLTGLIFATLFVFWIVILLYKLSSSIKET